MGWADRAVAASHRNVAVSAAVWLNGWELASGDRGLAPRDDDVRLWLALDDGRALAFRFHRQPTRDPGWIDALLRLVADDVRGMRYAHTLASGVSVQWLDAAPVIPQFQFTNASRWFDAECVAYCAALDREVIALLGRFEAHRDPHGNSDRGFFSSIRNYNRLAGQPTVVRARRLAALTRFPALLVERLLSTHHYPNVTSGKRHAWRDKDEALDAAIDEGRNLSTALAKSWKLSRGLVRAPLNAVWWPAGAERRGVWLRALDALPANKRPSDSAAFLKHSQAFAAVVEFVAGPDGPGDREIGASVAIASGFRSGWAETFEALENRGDLRQLLRDASDFLRVAGERSAVVLKRDRSIWRGDLARGWLLTRGLLGLIDASLRWHSLLDRLPSGAPSLRHPDLPALIGALAFDAGTASELLTFDALLAEGSAMKHCIGSYWHACVNGGRAFALTAADGTRGTAFVALDARSDASLFRLSQVVGPQNSRPSTATSQLAAALIDAINAASNGAARRTAVAFSREVESDAWDDGDNADFDDDDGGGCRRWRGRAYPALDRDGERELVRVLKRLGHPLPPPELVISALIAGAAHHIDADTATRLTVGQSLTLVREPDNAFDPRAVRIDADAVKVGYVPRSVNAEVAGLLDAGVMLDARLTRNRHDAPPYHRFELAIHRAAG